eukprot:764466-Hanusia_phi.AAC.7
MAMCATASAFSPSHALRLLNPRVIPSFSSSVSSLNSRRSVKAAKCAPSFGGRGRMASSSISMQTQTSTVVDPEKQLADLGITLPQVAAAAANYIPYVVSGNYVYVAGQIPVLNGEIQFKGKVPTDKSMDEAYQSARLCGLNLIAQSSKVKAACNGDLTKVKRVVKLVGFVNSKDDFTDQPKVINGASDLMVDVFGEIGRHARSAVGVNTLPLGVTTEVEAIFEVEVDRS